MKKLIFLILLFTLILMGCSSSDAPPPDLAEVGQPTLVYVYTDN